MASPFESMVHQLSSTAPGTGSVSLPATAASAGRRTFLAAFGNGGKVQYFIEGADGSEWGWGTITGTTTGTLARDTVVKNSDGTTSKINFTGIVNVWCGRPAESFSLVSTKVFDLAGTSTAYTLTDDELPPTFDGMAFLVRFDEACGDDPTLNLNGEGALDLVKAGGVNLEADDVAADDVALVIKQPGSPSAWFVMGLGGGGAIQDVLDDTLESTIITTGSSGTYACTTTRQETPADGYQIDFEANHENPAGGCTLNPDGEGAIAIKLTNGEDPYAGAIQLGGKYTVKHDGTNFQLLNPTAKPTWERLTSGIASAAPELDITDIPSDAERVVISIDGYVPSVDNTILVLRTSSNNGSSFDSGASDYAHARITYTVSGTVSPDGSDAAPGITIASANGNSGSERGSFKIELQAPGNTLNYKTIYFSGFYQNTNFVTVSGSGRRLSTSAVDAVRLIPGSGNFTCTYDVWVLRG